MRSWIAAAIAWGLCHGLASTRVTSGQTSRTSVKTELDAITFFPQLSKPSLLGFKVQRVAATPLPIGSQFILLIDLLQRYSDFQ